MAARRVGSDLSADVADKIHFHFAEELGDVLALALRGATFREGRLFFGESSSTGDGMGDVPLMH
jgi:hypothetical protein